MTSVEQTQTLNARIESTRVICIKPSPAHPKELEGRIISYSDTCVDNQELVISAGLVSINTISRDGLEITSQTYDCYNPAIKDSNLHLVLRNVGHVLTDYKEFSILDSRLKEAGL